MNDLLSIKDAALVCRIKWEHALDLMNRGTLTCVRVGPGNHVLKVRKSEVEALAKKWNVNDTARKADQKAKGRVGYAGTPGDSRRIVRRAKPAT